MSSLEARARFRRGDLSKAEYIEAMHRQHARLFEYPELIGDSDVERIEITERGVTITTRGAGVALHVDRPDKRSVPFEILNFSAYEKKDSDMILRLVRPGDRVLDVGANLGWYSLNIARLHGGSVRVDAFEPIPGTFRELARNVRLNGASNVAVHNFALSDRPGSLRFLVDPATSVSAVASPEGAAESLEEVQCEVRTVDGFVVEEGIRVDFIKCDVEGAELLVLRGGLECLRRDRPVVFAEMLRKWSARFDYHPNDIVDLMDGLGYGCFTAVGERLHAFGRMDEETLETNFFFLHREAHAGRIEELASGGTR
jgi:FkbM family methyltransferase